MKRYIIEVRQYPQGQNHFHTDDFIVVGNITRKIWAEQIGNFNPLFCRYKGKRTLIHSEDGDLSDPFRRTEAYANTFFIETH